MGTSPINAVIDRLRSAIGLDGAGLTDGELLTRFVDSRDDVALAALIRRHGPMVWGVCSRMLRSHHDAEDAFQATFLVLVRKADSVAPREAVGNWLYGVAYQTATRLRAIAARRGARERVVTPMPEPVVPAPPGNDLLPLLDEQLSRLPEKYRALIVLCHLEGKTLKEVAGRLGIPEGTAASRLARAREMLGKRLTRRGVTVSGAALASVLPERAALAAAPTTLVASTIRAASMMATGQVISGTLVSANVVALTDGVVKAMVLSKIKSVLAVVLVLGTLLGGLGVGHQMMNERPVRFGGVAQAVPVPAKEEIVAARPEVYAGTIRKPTGDAFKVAPVLGRHGVLLIHSEARWAELNQRAPDFKPEKPLPKIDFAKQSVVLIYAMGDSSKSALILEKSDLAASPPGLTFSYLWYNGPVRGEEFPSIKFLYAVIPTTTAVKLTVTSQPTEADRSPIITELSAVVGGKDGGDVVDGLQAAIAPKAPSIKLGDDILVDFALKRPDLGKGMPTHFGNAPESVFVWDGKYSNGYRNHAFFVTTPDGKTALLRPKVINTWEKNAPHPVAVTARAPYHLPNWAAAETFKSLKALGLDTSAPGTYTITGLYEETGGEADNLGGAGKVQIWGGSITSNTIVVDVKKDAK